MINTVTIINHLDESITIDLRSPEKSGFLVMNIDGLGPVKADVNFTDISGFDGSVYNSVRANSRNIVFELKFKTMVTADPTLKEGIELGGDIQGTESVYLDPETIRQKSYKYFPLKKRIKIIVEATNRTIHTYGYVESNEPQIFDSEEGTNISILCPSSYMFDLYPTTTVFSAITPLFEFPFSNESLILKLIEFSRILQNTSKSVVYKGDATIGMLIHIHATGSANDVVITDSDTLETIAINSAKLITYTGADISLGDDFWISTVKGSKYAILIRGGETFNILNCLGNPTWFELEKGDNVFAYNADSGLANLQFEIINDTAYEGI